MAVVRSAGLAAQPSERTFPATHEMYLMQIERTLGLLGESLARVHQLTPAIGDDPGNVVAPATLVARAQADEVGEAADDGSAAPSAAYAHMTRSELLAALNEGAERAAGRADQPVLLQGRPTLDNLLLDGFEPAGFADWSAVATGDRHWDLAIACRDVVQRCGPNGVTVLLAAYGMDLVDPFRLDWYSLALELLP